LYLLRRCIRFYQRPNQRILRHQQNFQRRFYFGFGCPVRRRQYSLRIHSNHSMLDIAKN